MSGVSIGERCCPLRSAVQPQTTSGSMSRFAALANTWTPQWTRAPAHRLPCALHAPPCDLRWSFWGEGGEVSDSSRAHASMLCKACINVPAPSARALPHSTTLPRHTRQAAETPTRAGSVWLRGQPAEVARRWLRGGYARPSAVVCIRMGQRPPRPEAGPRRVQVRHDCAPAKRGQLARRRGRQLYAGSPW